VSLIGTGVFEIILAIYCFVAVFLVNKPLIASAWFIFFRSTFQVAAFKGLLIFNLIPYFTIPTILLAISATVTLAKTSSFKLSQTFIFYVLFVILTMYFGALNLAINLTNLNSYFDFLIKIACPIFIFITTSVGIKRQADLYTALQFGSYSSVFAIASGLLQLALGGGYDYRDDTIVPGERIVGTIIDPNSFGIYLSLILFMIMPLVLRRKSIVNILFLAILIITIVSARNRGTWIALAIAIPITVLIFRYHIRIHYWIVGGIVLFVTAMPFFQSRFADLNKLDKYGQSQDTFSERIYHHIDLLEISLENPFIGAGIGSSELPISRSSGFIELAHNDYIRIAVETGYITLIIYLCFLFSQYFWTLRFRYSKFWDIQFATHCTVIYIIVMSFVDNIVGDILNYSMFMYIVAISFRAPYVEIEDNIKPRALFAQVSS